MSVVASDTEWYRCPKCTTSYLIQSSDPELHLIKAKKSVRCPNYLECEGHLVKRTFNNKVKTIDNARWISALDLYQAAAGIGLPEERNCSPKDIRNLLTGARVREVHIEEAPDPKKCILLSMTLENGKTIHVSSSVKGAIVYKVTNGR